VSDSPGLRRANWLPPIVLLALLAVSGGAALAGFTVIGDPSADFLFAAAIVSAGLLAWVALEKDLPRSQRLTVAGAVVAISVVGLAFTDVGPVSALRDLLRTQREPTPYQAPPPKAFDYEYPASDVVPNLAKTGPRDWPGYLGADRTGWATAPVKLAGDWKSNPPKLLWQHPVGGGVASPAVVGDFLISFEQRGKDEVVACYELRTGRQCWEHREDQYANQGYTGPGPQSTPTVVNGLVISFGGLGRLLCLDGATGKSRWNVDLFKRHKPAPGGFGHTASPLVVDDLVVCGIGGENNSLVAYDLQTGKLRWAAGSAGAGYSSPMLVTLGGVRQIVWFNAKELFGCDPEDGRELWSVPWNEGQGNNVCQPLVFSATGKDEPDALLISAGDEAGVGAYAVERTAEGFKTRELWKNKNLRLKYSTAIRVGDMAVGLDERILAAIDLKTGKRRWKHGDRFGYGQVIASGDQLIVQSEDGRIVLGEATETEFIERGKFQSVLKQTWNAPALSGNVLVLRNHETLAVYELTTEQKEARPTSSPPPKSSG
jgi:outer membrane protein assembly factor BamB